MEDKEGWKKDINAMNDKDLAVYYQWLFTIVDGLLSENKLLEMGGVFAKKDNEANFFIDEYSTNNAKINHYKVFLDHIGGIFEHRVNKLKQDDPIPGFKLTDEEISFYDESTLTSLLCNFQMFSVAVTEIQKTEKLLTEMQKNDTAQKNEIPLMMVTQLHTSFVTRMKCIIKTIIKKMAK